MREICHVGARLCVRVGVAALFWAGACACANQALTQNPRAGEGAAWQEHGRNPIIRIGDGVRNMHWNDPSVLKEDGGFRMWLSGGDPRDLKRIVVNVHVATSPDGVDWSINPAAVLSPGPQPGAWDGLRTETPAVVKVGQVYHLYYSGCDEANCRDGVYAIGHATSSDGVTWIKDPANPIITAQDSDRLAWGYRGVGEPGVLYDASSGTFRLYYTSMRYAPGNRKLAHIGILMSTSKDGSRFVAVTDATGARKLVLTRDIPNATDGAWFGYSTPAPVRLADGEIRLYCSFLVAPAGPATARHVTIVETTSSDGESFRVLNENVFEAGAGGWHDHQVRSPTVVEDGGVLRMWFAGETRRPVYGAAIGYAVRQPSSRPPS